MSFIFEPDLLRKTRVQKSLESTRTLKAFDIHCTLLATDTLIPIDVVTTLLNEADNESDGVWTLEGLTAFYGELASYYAENGGKEEKGMKRIIANWEGLINSKDFIFAFLFVIGGVMFVMGAFLFNVVHPRVILMLLLVGSIMYIINNARNVYNHPAGLLKHNKVVSDAKHRFKTSIMELATKKYHDGKRTRKKRLLRDDILMSYIRETVIHSSDLRVQLSKRDLELLLVKELGQIMNSAIREAIWNDINHKNTKSLSGQELYKYITSKDVEQSRLQCIKEVTWACLTSVGFWMKVCFLLGSVIDILMNLVAQFDAAANIPYQSLNLSKKWLFLIGTCSFTHKSYERKRDLFETKEKAKVILGELILEPDGSNNWIDEVYADLNADDGLDKVKLNTLLQRCGICLPEKEIERLFREIDVDDRGILYEDQIDTFVKKKTHHKYLDLMVICLKSFDFWAMQTWLWGSFSFLLVGYFPNAYDGQFEIVNVQVRTLTNISYLQTTNESADGFLAQMGSILFLLGGVYLCWSQYIRQSDLRHYRFQFYEALSALALDQLLDKVEAQDSVDLPIRTIKRENSNSQRSQDEENGVSSSIIQDRREEWLPTYKRWNSSQFMRGSSLISEMDETATQIRMNDLTKVLSRHNLYIKRISRESEIAETAGWSGVVTLRRARHEEDQLLETDLSSSLDKALRDLSILYRG